MEIAINIESGEPLFAQLIDQIKAAVLNGAVSPGEPLPSIRQLAGDLDLNAKTVAKAYRLLERDSVIQTRGYRGTFVHPDAVANSQVDLSGWAHERLARLVADLRGAGVTDAEIRVAFGNVMNERNSQGT